MTDPQVRKDSPPPAQGAWWRRLVPRLGIMARLALIGVVSIVAAVAAAVWTSVKIAEAEMYQRAQNALTINLKLLDTMLADYGAPSRQGNDLYFGTARINGNFDAVDRVKTIAGGTATIFLGDQRVATNVKTPDGARAVGTKLAAGPAYDAVFKRHETYRGEAPIFGETYLTIYEPIMSGGDVVGIAYVGVKKAEFFNVLQSLMNTELIAGGAVTLLAGLILLVVVRHIFAPLGTIRRELVSMAAATAQQELDARAFASLDDQLDALRQALYGCGDPQRASGMLMFGSKTADAVPALFDGIRTGDGTRAAVFDGDRCIATNAREADAARATGVALTTGPVPARVVKEAKSYRGEIVIADTPHNAICEPILIDGQVADGQVIGMLLVATPRHVVSEQAGRGSTARAANEIGEMQQAVAALGKATRAKEITERDAAEHRQEARDAQRRFQASQHLAQQRADEERAQITHEQTAAVTALGRALARLSDGDLTVLLNEGFTKAYRAIRDDFNTAVGRLRQTVGTIVAATTEVTNASSEISDATIDLSQRTEEQAASLEQTSAAMEEISAAAKRNAESAQSASVSAQDTSQVADRSGEVVAKTVGAMARIKESSDKISDIIGVIDEIARQTNMLALNAAVEAARAGEAGRGFAVVAGEVRSLAQRSSDAAKNIKELITNSNSQVQEGVDLVNQAGTTLGDIVRSIKGVADTVAAIASANREQSTGIEQINKALSQMDEITQRNSALVEQSAATAKALANQAEIMNTQIGVFKIEAGAGAAASAAGQATPKPAAAVRLVRADGRTPPHNKRAG